MAFAHVAVKPVSVDTLDVLERAALAVVELKEALAALSIEYRWIVGTMVGGEFADVYRLVSEAQRGFEQNYSDAREFGDGWRTQPATEREVATLPRLWQRRSRSL